MRIAVLLTTFNRKDKTVACLDSLAAQLLPAHVEVEVFLTDDGSRDGTVERVKELYPDIHIYHGNGSLFWAGGMRNSWRQALNSQFDYFLLLNDDTVLKENTIAVLLKNRLSTSSICVGSTADSDTGQVSYGGRKVTSSVKLRSNKVYSDTEYMDCDLGNANIMMVPKEIVNKIGILSEAFTHGIADYDYTLKAKKNGFRVLVAPGVLGYCVDDHGKNWKSNNFSLKERIAYLKSPKGLAYKEYLHYIRSHFPFHYPSAYFKLWAKTLFPFMWDAFKKSSF